MLNPTLIRYFYSKSFWKRVKFGDTTEDCWKHMNKPAPNCLHAKISLDKVEKNKRPYAHRIAWVLEYNEDPGNSLVLHSCSNPTCVNPNHLRLGTQQDNVNDMVTAGNRKRVDKEQIIALRSQGLHIDNIALILDCDEKTVRNKLK